LQQQSCYIVCIAQSRKNKEAHGMPNKKQGQVKGAEKLLSQMAKLYGLSDRGLVQALTYMRGVEDGGAPQKKGE
jgi:hypothetical protein